MSLTRRGFLAALLGTVTAVKLFPQLSTESAIEVPLGAWENIYHAAHRRAFHYFRQEMMARGVNVPSTVLPECVIGETLPSGALVRMTQGVDFRYSDVTLDDETVKAAMTCLAEYSQIDEFGGPCVPMGVEYGGAYGPLRMIVAYDVMADERIVRFDVIGAESEAHRRQRERYRQARLVKDIRRRLALPRLRPSLPS